MRVGVGFPPVRSESVRISGPREGTTRVSPCQFRLQQLVSIPYSFLGGFGSCLSAGRVAGLNRWDARNAKTIAASHGETADSADWRRYSAPSRHRTSHFARRSLRWTQMFIAASHGEAADSTDTAHHRRFEPLGRKEREEGITTIADETSALQNRTRHDASCSDRVSRAVSARTITGEAPALRWAEFGLNLGW